jgi:hypothetical protein
LPCALYKTHGKEVLCRAPNRKRTAKIFTHGKARFSRSEDIEENLDANVAPSSVTVQEPETCPDLNPPLERALENDTNLRDKRAHRQLKEDLVEHIWNKFGGRTHTSAV